MATIDQLPADTRDMAAAHRMFRREFGLMPGLVRAVAADDRERAALVADHIALVCSVLDHHHLGEEEYVWPLLRERCPQQPARIDVDVMEAQHQAIHKCLVRLRQDVAAWIDSASADTREATADAIDQLIPVMKEHLALEEERVVPLIEKYLTDAEYARVGQGQAV
jgi:hemerythrin-like domain-containing protein